jgi:hypothetical protein
MKNIITLSCIFLLSISKLLGQEIITDDIDNFWKAYDKIIATTDTVEQYALINDLYIKKGSLGLKLMMQARNYTAKSYVDAIRDYPKFWFSVRLNTLKAKIIQDEIALELTKLKKLYPQLKPANIYFTIGALRSNGTILGRSVLIGSELAMSDKHAVSSEFPEYYAVSREKFFTSNPINDVVLLCMHEYVHTQQKEMVFNLLSECLYEGVAEFVSVLSTGRPSAVPAVAYGKTNELSVKQKFEVDMFSMSKQGDWLWGDAENVFQMRDLGYYIGYAICERYYNKASDKKRAVYEMINLDYKNEKQIEKFIDGTQFFSQPINILYNDFEKRRPVVLSVNEFKNNSQQVNPNITHITLNFSAPLNKEMRGFEYGPMGEKALLRVKNFVGFSEDGKSATIEVELMPKKRYQLLISNRFESLDGTSLKPFLVDIKTADK